MNTAKTALTIVLMIAPWGQLAAQTSGPFSPGDSAAAAQLLHQFQFPRDLYDHPAYQTEWWYFTGNLNGHDGKPYGFELTFFHSYVPTGASSGPPQYTPIIFADLAVSDLDGQQFLFHKALA